MRFVGELSLWLALLMSAWGAAVGIAGARGRRAELTRSARRALLVAALFLTLVVIALWSALLAEDLSLRMVAERVSVALPAPYRVAALWAGAGGMLLLLAWTLGVVAAALVAQTTVRARALGDLALASLAGLLVLVLGWLIADVRPFEPSGTLTAELAGIPPALRDLAMLVYPPAVAVAAGAATVSLALAGAALVRRERVEEWRTAMRPWVLACWTALTVAIVASLWWSYASSAGASAWASAPVRDASIFAWFAAAALLHLLSAGAPDGRPDAWTVGAVVATTMLALLAFVGAAARATTGAAPFATSPVVEVLAALLALAAGVAAWRTARWRDADRVAAWGGALVAIGVSLVVLVAVASRATLEGELTIAAGERISVTDVYGRDWSVASEGISTDLARGYFARGISMSVWTPSGERRQLATALRQYMDGRGRPTFEPVTRAGLIRTPLVDLRVAILEFGDDDRETVRVRVAFVPIVSWLWVGGLLLLVGGVLRWLAPDIGAARS